MPPARTPKREHAQPSSSKTKLNNSKKPGSAHRRKQANPDANTQAVPGVQKIKAALRQTRRFLAKDNLAAHVRIETERRLKSLEADLAQAERARKERALAQRYHKVKFFERQKVTRKLNKTKREIEACTDKKEKKKLEKALLELRVDLNYILHYPKLKKYISLFPPEVRQKGADKGKEKETSSDEEKEETPQEKAATDAQREEIRQQIRQQMKDGILSAEPELEDHAARRGVGMDAEGDTTNVTSANKGGSISRPKRVPEIVEDEFFGEESGEEDDEDADVDMSEE